MNAIDTAVKNISHAVHDLGYGKKADYEIRKALVTYAVSEMGKIRDNATTPDDLLYYIINRRTTLEHRNEHGKEK